MEEKIGNKATEGANTEDLVTAMSINCCHNAKIHLINARLVCLLLVNSGLPRSMPWPSFIMADKIRNLHS